MENNTLHHKIINSEIKNNLTVENYGKYNFNKLLNYLGININKNINEQLDEILKNTTIKRGCCLTPKDKDTIKIKIKLPLNKDFKSNDYNNSKYKYLLYYISFPRSYCGEGYNRYSEKCDKFYDLYCKNTVLFFKALNKNKFKQTLFSQLTPECSCYGEKPDYITGEIAKSCYVDSCSSINNNIYTDPLSRKGCDASFCIQDIDFEKLIISGDFDVDTKLYNTCGGSIPDHIDKKTTKTNYTYYILAVITIILLFLFMK